MSVSSLRKQCAELGNKASEYESQKIKFQDKLSDSEARSMRENLLFTGIEETQNEDCCES